MASFRILSGAALLAAVALGQASPAAATTLTYNLTSCFLSTGCLASGTSYGTVTVSTVTADEVSVMLTLAPNEVFNIAGGNGAGKPLLFDISGNPTVTVSGLTSPFNFLQHSMTMADGSGKWNYGIQCDTTTPCGTGTSKMLTGPISFDVSLSTGITPASFIQNAKNLYFASDIGIPNGSGGYNTGDVGAPTSTTVPLPPAVVLFGSALVAGFALTRRRAGDRLALSV